MKWGLFYQLKGLISPYFTATETGALSKRAPLPGFHSTGEAVLEIRLALCQELLGGRHDVGGVQAVLVQELGARAGLAERVVDADLLERRRALLAQDKWRNKLVNILCKLLYLMVFPVMMVIFVCYELKYPEYDLFLPYFAMGIVVVLIIGTAAFFFYDPYKQDKKRVKNAKDYISEVEKIAKKQVKKNQKLRAKEEKKNQKIQLRTLEKEEAAREKEEKLQSKKAEKDEKKK